MLNVSFNTKSIRAVSVVAVTSVSVLLAACGPGSGTGQYVLDGRTIGDLPNFIHKIHAGPLLAHQENKLMLAAPWGPHP